MKSIGGVIGWFALIAALAVPAFLFYNWWSKMNAEKKEQTQGSSFQVKTPIFEKSEDARLSSGRQSPAKQGSPTEGGGQLAIPGTIKKPQVIRPSEQDAAVTYSGTSSGKSARSPSPNGKGSSRTPQQEAALIQAASAQAKVAFSPKVDRDPTLSLEEIDWLRDEDERRRMMWKDKKPVKRKKRPEQMVILQGIIETEKGIQAIINGGAYKQGSFIRGIRVVKIRASSVVFDYKGRRFVKRLSQ